VHAAYNKSLERLSARLATMKNEGLPEPMISFDKDDEDTLDFVAASANLRSIIFGIETKSRFDIKQMAGNIIPAIATTNAIVAGLCVLQSFKVFQGDFSATKEVFLSPFASERLLASDRIRTPNLHCPVCSVAQTRVLVDMARATLGDLVEDFLRLQLEYGEELVINHGSDLLYDIEETDNLSKKLSELGIKGDSFLTVIDEEPENPRVNLVLNVQESTSPQEKPIRGLDITEVPRKPSVPKTNGHAATSNGFNGIDGKRKADKAFGNETPIVKRPKVDSGINFDDVIIVEDTDGAIIIDDD